MSKLLIDEYPLMVLPSLAKIIGLNESIILQQIHYWLSPRINKNYKEGYYWVYNTYQQWNDQFPFWSKDTVKRTIQSLEKKDLLISKNLNKDSFDKTKWYTINYYTLSKIKNNQTALIDKNESPPFDQCNLHSSIYKDTETTTETTNSLSKVSKNNINSKSELVEKKEDEREMLNIWNKVIEDGISDKKLTTIRKTKLHKILNQCFHGNLTAWQSFCESIKTSDFLMGKVTNFKVSVDWVLKEEIIIKIMEGDYGVQKVRDLKNSETLDQNDITISDTPETLKIRQALLDRIGEGGYNSWFKKVNIEIENNEINFKAPTKFCKTWILNNYYDQMKEIISSLYNKDLVVNVIYMQV